MELKKYKLADIGKVITGKTPSTSIAENYAWGTIPFYTPEDVAKGLGMMGRNSRFISKTGFEEIASNTISGESVLVGCIGSDMGNVAYSNITCATNQQINAITQFKNGIEPLYVYYLLSTMKSYFQKIAGSTTTPILPKSVFEEIEIHLPDMKKQKDVVSILYALDRKIELNKLINDNLEAMAKQLYDYWFVQFDFPNEDGKPYKSSGGAMVWNEKLKREIPKGWHCGTLLDIAEYTNGLACQKYRPTDENKLPVIKIKEMHDGLSVDTEWVKADIPDDVKVFDGDVLFSWSASLEVMLWAYGNGGLNQHIFKVTSKNGYPRSFYFYQLVHYIGVFKQMAEARKTTMGHITQDHLRQSTIVLPPDVDIANKLEEKLCPIFDAIVKNSQEIMTFTKQRDELLPLLMNGQASVNYHLSDD